MLILEKVWEPASVDELRSAIEVIDPNMDGVTTVEQLKYFLVDLGETFSDSEFKEFIKSLPIDDDGRILTEGNRNPNNNNSTNQISFCVF